MTCKYFKEQELYFCLKNAPRNQSNLTWMINPRMKILSVFLMNILMRLWWIIATKERIKEFGIRKNSPCSEYVIKDFFVQLFKIDGLPL